MASKSVSVEKYSKGEFLPTQAYKQINSGLIGCQKVFAHFWLSQLGACRLGENSRNLRNPRLNICVHPHWPKLFVHIFRPQYSTHWPNTILHTAIAEKYAECLSHSKGLFKNIILFFYISVCRPFSPAPIFKRVELSRSPKKVEKRLYGSDQIPPWNQHHHHQRSLPDPGFSTPPVQTWPVLGNSRLGKSLWEFRERRWSLDFTSLQCEKCPRGLEIFWKT